MMRRRDFIAGLGAAAVPFAARAQRPDRERALLLQILRLQAEAAAYKVGQFIREIEGQVGWTTLLPWSAGTIDQRRFDGLRLLRRVPAITQLAQIDASGKERLRVSRLAEDYVGRETDFSQEPKFTVAMAQKVYYGPVYFRQSEPYMTLSLAGTRRDAGVSVVEVELKFIWDPVVQMKVGERGVAYIVDAGGRVIVHPDAEFQSDFSSLAQVQAAGSGAAPVEVARDIPGREVLTADAAVTALGWFVIAEQPTDRADR